MKYIYGPVKSRRLGSSLGVNLVPFKICTFNCFYCQLGLTPITVCERAEYLDTAEILTELKNWLQNNIQETEKVNYITISGSGEPTLNIKIGQLIKDIKSITAIPVAVITNSSLLNDPEVRKAILEADLIVPSLDAVSGPVFDRVNNAHKSIKIEEIINGLRDLRKEFKGKIWLEIMLVKGINDDLRHIKKMKEVIDEIKPDKIHLNSPVRARNKIGILSVGKSKLLKIKEILGDNCEIV